MAGILIAVLLGWAGGYRFYKKQAKIGILYLFTGGLCGIGWIIDVVKAISEYTKTAPAPTVRKAPANLPPYFNVGQDRYMTPRAEFTPNYVNQKHYIVYDFETTGVDPHECEIIEIGALKIADGQIVDRFQSLVKPFYPIPADATQVNHITNAMVENAPSASEVLPRFLDFIEDSKLVGYNIVKFDHIILRRYAAGICGRSLSNYITDVFLLSRKSFDLPKYTLSDVANYLGVNVSNAHRSIGDCETTWECLKKLQEIYKEGR